MRLVVLASGSAGNSALIELGPAARPTRLLVDAGLPRAEIEARLQSRAALGLADLDAVLVTHDHGDHAGSAAALGRPLFATDGTARVAELGPGTASIRDGEPVEIGACRLRPVALPHDAEEPVGFILECLDSGLKAGFLTDCGHLRRGLAEAYAGCDLLLLEANHEASLLRSGPYPPSVKSRISGRFGHLSNSEAGDLLAALVLGGHAPRVVLAAHLSSANNRPQLARRALTRASRSARTRILVAEQHAGTPIVALTPQALWVEPQRREQLAFAFLHGSTLASTPDTPFDRAQDSLT